VSPDPSRRGFSAVLIRHCESCFTPQLRDAVLAPLADDYRRERARTAGRRRHLVLELQYSLGLVRSIVICSLFGRNLMTATGSPAPRRLSAAELVATRLLYIAAIVLPVLVLPLTLPGTETPLQVVLLTLATFAISILLVLVGLVAERRRAAG